MALRTLKGIEKIGGFGVTRGKPEDISWDDYDKTRKDFPIHISDKINSISFKLQDGPVGESGVNGCQVDTIIEAAYIIIKGLNEKLHSTYNLEAMACLDSALTCLASRKHDRMIRGVEGENIP